MGTTDTIMATTMGTTTTTTVATITTTTTTVVITTTTTAEVVVVLLRRSGIMAAGRETVSHLTMGDVGVTPRDGTRVVLIIIPHNSIRTTPGPTRRVIIIMENKNMFEK